MYPGEWKGVPDNKAGVATFMVDGKRYDIKLESFGYSYSKYSRYEAYYHYSYKKSYNYTYYSSDDDGNVKKKKK